MSKKQISTGIAVVVALVVVFYFTNGLLSSSMINKQAGAAGAAGQLVVQDEVVGTGATAQPGDMIRVNYTGKLANGTVFDTSIDRPASPSCPPGTAQGFCFTLGAGQVIQGWEQGLVGMKVGGTRTLIIPPELAYGSQDYGPIPGGSTLIFQVTLLSLQAPATPGAH